ncbi:MAG: glycosyltransferase family 4 protein [Oligoflexia bacterium]|nr:glycosyltransferase family 4 protein [Oligoflexia bacterium]
MKIQIFHNKYKIRGGEDIMVDREVSLLRSHAHEVSLELWDNNSLGSILGAVKAAKDCNYSKKSENLVREKIESFKPDICHVHNFFPLLTPAVFSVCNEFKIPVVLTAHNYRMFCANGLFLREGKPCEICLNKSPFHAVLYSCYRNSYLGTLPVANMISQHKKNQTWNTKVDAVIALNEFAKSKMIKGGINERKIHVRFNYSEDFGERSKIENYAIYFGRISKEKGVHTLIKAWRAEFPLLYLVGEGEIDASWKENSNIKFIQGLEREEALDFLKKARFFILPTECYEGGTPLSVIEALSYGIPVLVSRIGGLGEIIKDKENGLYFEAGDCDSISTCIDSFLRDAELEKRLAGNARNLYIEKFKPEVAYRLLLEIYEKIL